MDGMEQKLNSILSNPEMMSQIMSLANSLGQQKQEKQEKTETPPTMAAMPSFDPAMLQRIAGLMQQSGIDQNQQALLKALRPYLSSERISKLEKAMRAAKIAGFASTALAGSGGFFQTGR